MLDGILGRGFTVKCKSLIKTTRTRMEMVRKRAEAKQKFMREDLGKLLANGLDINAYGRTEEYIAGMNIMSCYDYLDQSCEYILKLLARMQKIEECPEECKEVVASLMYAAARFSELPELRDLRDTFQERYGNDLAVYVNQKFVEKVSSRPPTEEKKIRVLHDIASEFSIHWDSKGFQKRMATPVVAQAEVHKADKVKQRQSIRDEKSQARNYGEGNIKRKDEADRDMAGRKDVDGNREKPLLKRGGSSLLGENDALIRGRQSPTEHTKHSYPVENGDRKLKPEKSREKLLDNGHGAETRPGYGIRNPKNALFYEKPGFDPNTENLKKIDQEEGSATLKSVPGFPLPPPYVKPKDKADRPPYVMPKEDNGYRSSKVNNGSDRSNSETNHHDHEERFAAPVKIQSYGREEHLDSPEEQLPLPKPRSLPRKHHKSSSSYSAVDDHEDVRVADRRKDHSRRGLHVLFDEDHHRKDDEERMIDKLLLHYSKKPSSYDSGKLRKKVQGQQPASRKIPDYGGPSMKREVMPPARTVSLPNEQNVTSPEPKKVYTRANSFQPDNQARHVHPKLPDCDDLAARFAALKGR